MNAHETSLWRLLLETYNCLNANKKHLKDLYNLPLSYGQTQLIKTDRWKLLISKLKAKLNWLSKSVCVAQAAQIENTKTRLIWDA